MEKLYNEVAVKPIYSRKLTNKERILVKIYKVKNKIADIKSYGATWKFNTATGECEYIPPKLNDEESKRLEELKLELKKLEIELKKADIENDFEDNE